MLQSEFESITGIYPDMVLFEEINKEYMDGDWEDKHIFCAAYKKNKDGLAEKIQRRTSEKLWKQDAVYSQTIASNNKIIAGLRRYLTEEQTRCAELEKRVASEESALLLESMTKTEMVWGLIAVVNGNIQRQCSIVAEGDTSEDNLKQLQKWIAQRTELRAVLSELQGE